ncbi:MAG: MFS transporter [Massilia sp.]|nr:MFS transporter [Massilia sp.]
MPEDFANDPAHATSTLTEQPPSKPIDKIIIAIHGIGSQRHSDTIRSVARRFCNHVNPPLPVMPLGFFFIGKGSEVRFSRLDTPVGNALQTIGFAEVFWADIPRQVVQQDDTLEETKAWGTTVSSRAREVYLSHVTDKQELKGEDFALAANVVDELIDTIATLETLLAVFAKMGLFKFDLAPLLRDFIDDVQIVTEFGWYRQKIVARFHDAMIQIVTKFTKDFPDSTPEIYIIAHSEGSVVSFLGLLEALSGRSIVDPETTDKPHPPDWIRFVRGFMTIGSPIDKHLVLWPKLWEREGQDKLLLASRREGSAVVFGPASGPPRLRLEHPIQWRNYYDFGDPIGFRLEGVAEFLKKQKCKAFDFASDKERDDFGFSRYCLPGKAHIDYWEDATVFGHFIDDVVMRDARQGTPAASAPRPPKDRMGVGFIATSIPYLLTLALHFCAVFLLLNAATNFLLPENPGDTDLRDLMLDSAKLGLLMSGVTGAARLPRLVKTAGLRWHCAALTAFLLGAMWVWLRPPQDHAALLATAFLANAFQAFAHVVANEQVKAGIALLLVAAVVVDARGWLGSRALPFARLILIVCGALLVLPTLVARLAADTQHPGWPLVLAAAVVAATGWLAPRSLRIARRTLMVCGAILLVVIMGHLLVEDSVLSAWPLMLAGLASLFLWRLGILLFDLAFVWHRYIRCSVAVQTLCAWNRGDDAEPSVTLKHIQETVMQKKPSPAEARQPDKPS